jgi:serine/threonine protein kinase
MTSALQRFIDLLLQSGVVTREEIRQIRSQLSEEAQTDEMTTDHYVLQQLADSGHLTDFQASAVHQGKSDELMLDDYLIMDEIGRGGMGRVYKARHTLMQREVAVKFTLADDPDWDSDQRFRREVEGLSKLVHPNIVSALDAGYRGKHCYLVMEFVEGTDLAAYIRKQGPMNFSDAIEVMIQAAEGLKYVHRKKIIHRDIKPGNLLFTPDHTVKVLDVGLARYEQRDADENVDRTATELTRSGAIVGTVDYMAPEQALNSHEVTPAADVYSLGCTLHYLLTGKPPFRQRGKSVLERVVAHREMDIPKLSQLVTDVPKDFDPVFSKMLAKDPEERYIDAGELLVDLKRVQRDESVVYSGATTVIADHIPSPGNAKTRFLALAALTLLGISVMVGFIVSSSKTDPVASGSTSAAGDPEVDSEPAIVQPALPCDLMEYVNPSANVLSGEGWLLAGGTLTIPDGSPSKLLIPVSIPSDYQLLGEIRRVSGTGPFVVLIPIRGKSQCFLLVDSIRNDVPVSGFGFNSAGRLAITGQNAALSRDEPSRLRLEVRADSLSYFLDDRLVVRWDGDPGQLRVAGGWSATFEPAFVVGSNHDASFEVSNLRVEPLASPRLESTDPG